MKKIAYTLLLSLLLVFIFATFAYADSNIVESPDVKIVIDGKLGTYTDVPIVVNDRTLLPLRAILINLGVQNDEQHIIWNGSDQSITIIKDSTKINLKVNSQTAYVNDKPITLDAAPMLYKDKTYIPARFVAQSLGKKVVWDGSMLAVLMRDEAEFNRIKDILDKSDAATKDISKCKFALNMGIGMEQKGFNMNMNIDALGEIDMVNKIMHMTMSMPLFGQKMDYEAYYANNAEYDKNSTTGEWAKKALPKEEFDKKFKSSELMNFEANESLCAGLVIGESKDPNEILLKGNVYLEELLNQVNSSTNASSSEINSTYLEITIDKGTNLIKKISMDISANIKAASDGQQVSAKITMTYSDYNGNFVITLPKDIEDAVIEENTL